MEENLKDNHFLSKTLQAHGTSKRDATGVSPFSLTYRDNAILLLEVLVLSLRIALQNNLILKDYLQAMTFGKEELDQVRMDALDQMIIQKEKKDPKGYNKKL